MHNMMSYPAITAQPVFCFFKFSTQRSFPFLHFGFWLSEVTVTNTSHNVKEISDISQIWQKHLLGLKDELGQRSKVKVTETCQKCHINL